MHVEQTFGQWKNKWRILKQALSYDLGPVTDIIYATAVLHNYCKIQKEDNQGPTIAHPTIHSLKEYESTRSLNDWLQKIRQNLCETTLSTGLVL